MKYLFCFNVHDLSTGFILIDITDGTLLHITFSITTRMIFLSLFFNPILQIIITKGKMFQVWDLATLQCIQTLSDHTGVVMSVLCWDQFLLSCSLDQTIKVSLYPCPLVIE